ncbi:hypothetical protein MILUP08_42253 [Micromonospora lupini str. Lupac 08]|uniref:Uncharacterized protein n=1 Tax=Micromonospora lupini str. Lupac 08 TaxID=1150864 RepID=I0L0I5_9ACTN|nr:hypothetical protein MILUP08_42253 [Micromonospora lupini str. Lupac 08]
MARRSSAAPRLGFRDRAGQVTARHGAPSEDVPDAAPRGGGPGNGVLPPVTPRAARIRLYQVTGREEAHSSHKRTVFMALVGNCTPLPPNTYLLLRAFVDPGAVSGAQSNLTAGGRCPGTWRVVLRPGMAGGSRPSDDERENQ